MYSRYAKFRDQQRLTDYKVAKATGIATSTISDWKRGLTTPKYDKMKAIAEILGVTVQDLMEEGESNDN